MQRSNANKDIAVSTTYSSAQLIAITGASPRMLQWWDEHNVIRAVHVGKRREWSREDVIAASLVMKLRSKGVSLQRIRWALPTIRRDIARGNYTARPFFVAISGSHTMVTEFPLSVVNFAVLSNGSAAVCEIAP